MNYFRMIKISTSEVFLTLNCSKSPKETVLKENKKSVES